MTNRWAPPLDRWTNAEEPMAAAEAFLAASFRLIGRHRPSDDWSETERLGMRLATRLQTAFQFVPDDYYVWVLSKALDAFDRPPSHKVTRAWCVRAIAEWGLRWHQPEWKASDQSQRFLLRQLVDALGVNEEAFYRLEAKSGRRELSPEAESYLSKQLDAFDVSAKGKAGRKSAETILAELVVHLGEPYALWFSRRGDEDDPSMEDNLRLKLTTAGDEYRRLAQQKKKARPTKKAKARKSNKK
jgi:hypothetical protein